MLGIPTIFNNNIITYSLLLETMPQKGPISLSVQNKVIVFTST